MIKKKARLVEAEIVRVMGPDVLEARVDLEFDISVLKRLKLAGVDSKHLRALSEEEQQKATEFLRSRLEGKIVLIRPMRKGEHFYVNIRYGVEESDILDEMVRCGLLKKFRNWNGDED